MVDALGHPILPMCHAADLKSQQNVVYQIFTKAYGKFYFYLFNYNILIAISEVHQARQGSHSLAEAVQGHHWQRVSEY
jgi:hypothetical protein